VFVRVNSPEMRIDQSTVVRYLRAKSVAVRMGVASVMFVTQLRAPLRCTVGGRQPGDKLKTRYSKKSMEPNNAWIGVAPRGYPLDCSDSIFIRTDQAPQGSKRTWLALLRPGSQASVCIDSTSEIR
jgi:hypothetical protein